MVNTENAGQSTRAGFDYSSLNWLTVSVVMQSCWKEFAMLCPSRILIVEDEEILADNLKIFLGRRTPDVRIAADAEAAIKMAKSFSPDLVILDFALPGVDGLRAYHEIVGSGSGQANCVMITGHMTEMVVEKAHSQGINQMLCKPFSFAELQQAIDRSY
jgi:DNA-binding response OmpR family regulator